MDVFALSTQCQQPVGGPVKVMGSTGGTYILASHDGNDHERGFGRAAR